MDTIQSNQIQPYLIELRDKLVQTLGSSPERSQFAGFISKIDAALHKIENGSYGICEQCSQPEESSICDL